MRNKDNIDHPVVETGHPESPGEGMLTGAARAIGSAIGKVSGTLHLAESKPVAAAQRKKSAAKKATKKPALKKAAKKAPAPAKKSAKRTKS